MSSIQIGSVSSVFIIVSNMVRNVHLRRTVTVLAKRLAKDHKQTTA